MSVWVIARKGSTGHSLLDTVLLRYLYVWRIKGGVLASGRRTILSSIFAPDSVFLCRTSIHVLQSKLPQGATFAMSLSSSSSEVSLLDSNSSWELLRKLDGGKGRDPSSGLG